MIYLIIKLYPLLILQVVLDGTVGTVVVTTMPMAVAGVNQPNWT